MGYQTRIKSIAIENITNLIIMGYFKVLRMLRETYK